TGSGDGAAVKMGENTLSITAASGSFSGIISGAGGLTIEAGEQTLGGDNTYSGLTTVNSGATLTLEGTGDIAFSGLDLDGTFDMSAADGNRTINGLAGEDAAARILLGANSLVFSGTADGATYAGTIEGTGGVKLADGEQTLTGD